MAEGDRATTSEVIAVFGPTASGKSAVAEHLADRLGTAPGLPGQFRTRIEGALDQAIRFAEEVLRIA